MLWCMLIDDCTSVPTWQACRDRHIVLIFILVKIFSSWAFYSGLESYPRSYKSVLDILHQSMNSKIIFSG
jgi:hypothetical protein